MPLFPKAEAVDPYEDREDVICRAAWVVAEAISEGLREGPGRDPSGWAASNRDRILGAYRELHAMFGRASNLADRVIAAEKAFVMALDLLKVKTRYNDKLSEAAGIGVAEGWGDDLAPNEAAQACIEARALAPDCIMISPGDLELAARIGSEGGQPEPVQVHTTTAASGIVGTSMLQALLPPGLVSPVPLLPGAGDVRGIEDIPSMVAGLPVYDLALVREGLLQQSGIGSWDVQRYRAGKAVPQVSFLNYKPGQTVAGAKEAGLQPVEFTVPFEVVGCGAGALATDAESRARVEQVLQRFSGMKKAGDKHDPRGTIPFDMDGDFPLHQIVTGEVLKPDTPDRSTSYDEVTGEKLSDHDIYDDPTILLSMFWWMANAKSRVTFLHTEDGGKDVSVDVPVLACWQQSPDRTYVRDDKSEKIVKAGTWMLTVWVKSKPIWKLILDKKIKGFSIGYIAMGRIEQAAA